MMNESKNQRQLKSASIAYEKQVGTIVQKQGFGKTRTGCLIAKNIINYYQGFVCIIVHSQVTKKQWLKEINKIDNLHSYTLVYTIEEYKNLHTVDKDKFVGTILDEIHLFSSLNRRLLLENINTLFKIGLTATYPKNCEFATYLKGILPVIDEIPDWEYEQNNWNVGLKEVCIVVDLTPEERNAYDEYTEIIKETLSVFDNNYELINKALKGDKYVGEEGGIELISATAIIERFAASKGWEKDLDLSIDYYKQIDDIYNPRNLIERVIQYYDVIRKRLTIVYNAEEKIKAVIHVLPMLTSYTTVLFSESTTMAEKVKDSINEFYDDVYCLAYHSKIETITLENGKKFGKTKQLNYIIENLTNGNLRAISVVKSFNTGIDIPILKAAIILSGSRSYITNEQRKGRVTRLDESHDTAFIVNIVVRNTVDYKAFIERNQSPNIYKITLENFIKQFYK